LLFSLFQEFFDFCYARHEIIAKLLINIFLYYFHVFSLFFCDTGTKCCQNLLHYLHHCFSRLFSFQAFLANDPNIERDAEMLEDAFSTGGSLGSNFMRNLRVSSKYTEVVRFRDEGAEAGMNSSSSYASSRTDRATMKLIPFGIRETPRNTLEYWISFKSMVVAGYNTSRIQLLLKSIRSMTREDIGNVERGTHWAIRVSLLKTDNARSSSYSTSRFYSEFKQDFGITDNSLGNVTVRTMDGTMEISPLNAYFNSFNINVGIVTTPQVEITRGMTGDELANRFMDLLQDILTEETNSGNDTSSMRVLGLFIQVYTPLFGGGLEDEPFTVQEELDLMLGFYEFDPVVADMSETAVERMCTDIAIEKVAASSLTLAMIRKRNKLVMCPTSAVDCFWICLSYFIMIRDDDVKSSLLKTQAHKKINYIHYKDSFAKREGIQNLKDLDYVSLPQAQEVCVLLDIRLLVIDINGEVLLGDLMDMEKFIPKRRAALEPVVPREKCMLLMLVDAHFLFVRSYTAIMFLTSRGCYRCGKQGFTSAENLAVHLQMKRCMTCLCLPMVKVNGKRTRSKFETEIEFTNHKNNMDTECPLRLAKKRRTSDMATKAESRRESARYVSAEKEKDFWKLLFQ
jgi:hypothetical protein